jgi:exopolysaccharide production protein ExoQ
MKAPGSHIDHSVFLKNINRLLFLILLIKIAGFFTWVDNVNVIRVFKIITRIAMTIAIIRVHSRIVRYGTGGSLKWKNSLSPILYCAYLVLGLASFMWSTDPGYSLLQWIMDFESFVFAFYFMRCLAQIEVYFPESKIRFYNLFGNAAFYIILVFDIGVAAAPGIFYRMTHGGEEARLGGWIMNPNELGMLCVVAISCFIFDLYRNHQKMWTIGKILLVLFALVLTGSRSSMVGFLLIIFFHIRRSHNSVLRIFVNLGALLAIPVILETIIIKGNGGGLDEVLSMTGRLPFWQALLNEGLPREPWLGYGFMRINYQDTFQGVHTYAGHMTHNTFMQVVMNLGFIGFTLVLAQFIITIKSFLKTKPEEKKLMLIGILIPVVINSFTEFGIFGETNYGILFYQLLIFMVSVDADTRLSMPQKLRMWKRRPELAGTPLLSIGP